MQQVPNLFWLCILVWVWGEMSALFRVAMLKAMSQNEIDFNQDRAFRWYKTVALIGLNMAALLGLLIISVSFYNVLGG